MIAPAAEQTLIPSAACFHIGNGDQRLRTHLRAYQLPTDVTVSWRLTQTPQ